MSGTIPLLHSFDFMVRTGAPYFPFAFFSGGAVVDTDAMTIWSILLQIIYLLQVFVSRNFCRIFGDYAAKYYFFCS